MPKKQVRASANALTTAADPAASLIAAVRLGTAKDAPSPEALEALRKILAHNDTQAAPTKRVGSQAAIDMLQAHYGWKGGSLSALNSLCHRVLGRKSWGTP